MQIQLPVTINRIVAGFNYQIETVKLSERDLVLIYESKSGEEGIPLSDNPTVNWDENRFFYGKPGLRYHGNYPVTYTTREIV
jgi:hypothetical protein